MYGSLQGRYKEHIIQNNLPDTLITDKPPAIKGLDQAEQWAKESQKRGYHRGGGCRHPLPWQKSFTHITPLRTENSAAIQVAYGRGKNKLNHTSGSYKNGMLCPYYISYKV